jgi:hypothetical protein
VRVRPRLAIFVAVVALLASASPAARGTLPYPPRSGDPSDYSRLHIRNGACMPLGRGEATPPGSDLPKGFDCRTTTKLTDYRAQPGDPDYDPLVASNPQELFGQKGSGTNRAWEVTTGRPDTVIAIMDSGILWSTPALAKKVALNWRELPVPCPATPCSAARARSARSVDVDHDGLVTVADYEQDARVRPANGTFVTGQDLIRTFSDGRDDDGNGYVDDIAGWDFYQADNDPSDDVTYGHGTGEAKDSSAEIELEMTQCPNCRFLPLRVGDSFIADINHWAEAVVYAVDNRASVVQEALGTLNHTSFGQIAADYAYRHGVLIVASEADESAGHHNYPAALNHTMVVNSLTHYLEQGGVALERPLTYLAFNGCTNFGGYTWVSVPSNSCSSDATGQSSGMAGLLYSAAQNAVEKGVIKPDRSGKPLSAEEAKQLFRAAAQDIDFATPQGSGPPNNVATTLPASQRFATTPRWDQITGWGRINADRLVRFVAAGHIPPEADIAAPRWWQSLGTTGKVKLTGRVAAPRARSYRYEVQFAPGVQAPPWPSSDRWTTVASGRGTKAREGKLATLDLARIRAAIDAAPSVYTPLDDPTSPDLPEKDAFRVRVVVHTDRPGVPDAVEQRQFFSTHDPDLLPGFPRLLGSVAADGAGSPAFADIDGDGANELVVPDGDGRVHAFKPDGTEARGWPVRTGRIRLPTTGDNGYTTAAELASDVRAPLLLGSPAVADLDGDGKPEVAAADTEGYLYVWHHDGHMARGFPVSVNRARPRLRRVRRPPRARSRQHRRPRLRRPAGGRQPRPPLPRARARRRRDGRARLRLPRRRDARPWMAGAPTRPREGGGRRCRQPPHHLQAGSGGEVRPSGHHHAEPGRRHRRRRPGGGGERRRGVRRDAEPVVARQRAARAPSGRARRQHPRVSPPPRRLASPARPRRASDRQPAEQRLRQGVARPHRHGADRAAARRRLRFGRGADLRRRGR